MSGPLNVNLVKPKELLENKKSRTRIDVTSSTQLILPELIKTEPLNYLTILIVDDSEAYAIKLKKMLSLTVPTMKESFYTLKLVHTTSVFCAKEALTKFQFSFAMIDNIFTNDKMTGLELCYHLKSKKIQQISPMVIISGQNQDAPKDFSLVRYPCTANTEQEICNKSMLDTRKLKEMLNKYALPMTRLDAMQAITNATNIYQHPLLIGLEHPTMEYKKVAKKLLFEMFLRFIKKCSIS